MPHAGHLPVSPALAHSRFLTDRRLSDDYTIAPSGDRDIDTRYLQQVHLRVSLTLGDYDCASIYSDGSA